MFANILFSGSSPHKASENCYLTKIRGEGSQNTWTLQCNYFIRCENKKVSFNCHFSLIRKFVCCSKFACFIRGPAMRLNLHFTWKFLKWLLYEFTYVTLCDGLLCLASSRSTGLLLVIGREFSLWLTYDLFTRSFRNQCKSNVLLVMNVFILPLTDVTPKIINWSCQF